MYAMIFKEIRELCMKGSASNIDKILSLLNDSVDIPTTRAIDFYLGQVENFEGIRRIEHHLFNGTQIQRNYCTLFFARRDDWDIVNRAYKMGLIDWYQAYSK